MGWAPQIHGLSERQTTMAGERLRSVPGTVFSPPNKGPGGQGGGLRAPLLATRKTTLVDSHFWFGSPIPEPRDFHRRSCSPFLESGTSFLTWVDNFV